MFQFLLQLPLTSPTLLIPLDVAAAILVTSLVLAGTIGRRGSTRRRRRVRMVCTRIIGGAAGACAVLLLVWWLDDVQDTFGVAFTLITRMWIGFAGAAAGLAIVAMIQGRTGLRVLGAGTAALVLCVAALGVNVDFGAYRSLAQVLTTNPYPKQHFEERLTMTSDTGIVNPATWHAPADMPAHGKTVAVDIPGTVSHFHARHAALWLPPAARTADPPVLPVLLAFSGQPGSPSDLFETGGLNEDLERYAAAHNGLAPIVVAPDQLGAPNHNPMCVDSRALGDASTYIMRDVMGWVRSHFTVPAPGPGWGVLGFSEGATCAMQFVSGHPNEFHSALAISSELTPLNGTLQQTVTRGFNGSTRAFQAATPSAMLAAHAPLRDHMIVFGYGADDSRYAHSTQVLRAAAVRAGVQTKLVVSPGSAHDWNTVRYVLTNGLPAIIGHLGLQQGPVA